MLLVQFYTVQSYNQLRLDYSQAALMRSSLVSSPLLSSMVKEKGEVRRGEDRRGQERREEKRRRMMMLVREIHSQYLRCTTS